MKKIVLLLIALQAYASVHAQQQTDFGLRAGAAFANWYGLVFDNGQEYQRRFGFFGGGYMNHHFSEVISVETGLYLSSKGFTMSGTFSDPDFTISGSVDNISTYMDVPLLLRFYVAGGFHVHGGGQLSYLLSNKIKGEITINGASNNEEVDTAEFIEDLDFAAVLGLGYDFPSGLNINIDFDFGVAEVLAVSPYASWDEANNRVIKISLGYSFNKK